MENFFEYIIMQYDGISIYDFAELLVEEYNIKIEKHKIVEAINNSAMHYDQITEQLFQSDVTTCGLLSDDVKNEINYIISAKFKSGFRISSSIDFERFENYYAVEYSEDFAYRADSIDTYLTSVAVVFDDRAYIFDDEGVNFIRVLLEQMDSPCIYIGIFFEKHSADLYELGIFSMDMLKAFIEKKYVDIFCRRDYISFSLEVSPANLIREVFNEREIWSFDELFERLPCLKQDTIRQILNRDEYLRIDTGTYTHIEHIDLPDSEGEKMLSFVEDRLQSKDYVVANELDFSRFREINPHHPFSAIRDAVFSKFLSGCYNKRGQVISRIGQKLSVIDILEQYCSGVETVSFSELNAFEATFDPDGRTHSQCLTAAYNVLIRVSNELFVAKNKVSFDVDKIDEIIELYCSEDFIPLKNVTDFSLFPYAGYPWSLFLLESYVRRFSRVFKFDVRAVNSANIGVIVRKSFVYDDYDDVLATALAKSTLFLDDETVVGAYLFNNGYIGWRNLGKNESKIIQKAKSLRKGGAV